MGLFDRNTKTDKKLKTSSSRAAKVTKPDGPEELPVIALKNTVIYPHTVVPVFFEDTNSMSALDEAQRNNGMIAAFALTQEARDKLEVSDVEIDDESSEVDESATVSVKAPNVKPEDLYKIGTACKIHRVMPVTGRPGAMVVLQGVEKVKSVSIAKKRSFLAAVVGVVKDQEKDNKEIRALMRNALSSAQKIIQNTPYLPQELQIALEDLSDPLKFVYLLATLVRFGTSEKQEILEINKVEEKLKKTAAVLSREMEQIELGGKIMSNVKKEFNKMSREAFLRQQLKEIQRELGEEVEGEREAREYRQKLEEGDFPESVKKELEREITRIESMHPQSSEYQVLRTYIELVLDLPWSNNLDESEVDIKAVMATLEKDHYGIKEVKQRIVEFLAAQKLNKSHKGPILCLVGPPGVGKTSLGRSIANALGREFVRVSLGGVKDESEIRGHRRTYVGAMPGKIIQSLRRVGSNSPVFMLDEIDKVGNDFRGDPSSALLEVLDPEQNSAFQDHYLDVDYDLSNVMFIATANVLDTIQPALRDRMEIIEISGYIEDEKTAIAKKYLWPRVLKRHGLPKSKVKLSDRILRVIVDQYTREAGVRNLERALAKVARKVAYLFVTDAAKVVTINEKRVREFLGPRKMFSEVAARTSVPGVATGLAYTQAGGEILFVEATKMPGGKKFTLTGSLGDVMKESASAALSLIRARAQDLGIDGDFFKHEDIHVHVPSGATPKDGPSAGVAITAALASLLLDRPARNDVAMTGEITLSGLVLPIGGVKEKVLAAKRAGIKTVVLPKKNSADVSEIDASLLRGIDFVYVENIDEALAAVIASPHSVR
ncbi:endopeptidase La [candidate division WWE3 bacterium]|uniref:Lon protease n=1 Tax=candidate division WWE3 bacterium TaxID=2053526 RepID=A0A955RRT5_UNCKA|nr:endopeptidase La [candidate division WWE3 bacterium]